MKDHTRDTTTVPSKLAPQNGSVSCDALVLQGTRSAWHLPHTQKRWSVGASTACDICIDDQYASANHCTLARIPGGKLVVRDRDSRNGTYLNGNRIWTAELHPGAVLMVGRTTLVATTRTHDRTRTAIENLLGEDAAFRKAVDTALRAARTDCSILIVGETGTGKELVARAIHDASPRSHQPYIAVNCGGISRDLIGSELFGHHKGGFTGAVADREGLFAQANGGTLFLDELGELPVEQQPHLLRALETRRIRPIGDDRERPIDVRLISATNRLDLNDVSSTLRRDVYHRVATVPVRMPPLRERGSDVELLARAFLSDLEPRYGLRELSQPTIAAMRCYHWPGNVRELNQAMQRAVALSSRVISLSDVLPQQSESPQPPAPIALASEALCRLARDNAGRTLNAVDANSYQLMAEALRRHQSIRRAAASLGMPRSTFADRARRWGLLKRDRRSRNAGK